MNAFKLGAAFQLVEKLDLRPSLYTILWVWFIPLPLPFQGQEQLFKTYGGYSLEPNQRGIGVNQLFSNSNVHNKWVCIGKGQMLKTTRGGGDDVLLSFISTLGHKLYLLHFENVYFFICSQTSWDIFSHLLSLLIWSAVSYESRMMWKCGGKTHLLSTYNKMYSTTGYYWLQCFIIYSNFPFLFFKSDHCQIYIWR